MHVRREVAVAAQNEFDRQPWDARRKTPGRFNALAPATGWSMVVLSGLVLMGCASLGGRRSEDKSTDDGVLMDSGAIILSGSALTDGSGTLLAAMRGKIPNFRVLRNVDRQCPQLSLRNRVNLQGFSTNPHVYVDGTRTTDTCVLESLRSSDVERVEVYPQGFTKRPGYGTHADGLILVFMRSG